MRIIIPLEAQTTEALAEALDAVCDAIEGGRVAASGLLAALDYGDRLAGELHRRATEPSLEQAVMVGHSQTAAAGDNRAMG